MTDEIQADVDTNAKERRRAARVFMPIHRFALGHEPTENIAAITTIDERLAMVWPLSRLAFEIAGKPIEPPPRHELSGRVFRQVEP